MRPDPTGGALLFTAWRLGWKGPGWPAPDSYAAAVLDALYWGELPPWETLTYMGGPTDFGMHAGGRIRRAWASVLPSDQGPQPRHFAAQWATARTLLGDSKAERARTLATVPAGELNPILIGLDWVFWWCQGDGLKPPPE